MGIASGSGCVRSRWSSGGHLLFHEEPVVDVVGQLTSTKRQRVDMRILIHSLALRATNGQNRCTPRKF
jgi:hypothetical protein